MAESGMNEIIIWNYCINVFIGMARWPRARCASDPTYVGPVQCCSYTHTRLRSWPFFFFANALARILTLIQDTTKMHTNVLVSIAVAAHPNSFMVEESSAAALHCCCFNFYYYHCCCYYFYFRLISTLLLLLYFFGSHFTWEEWEDWKNNTKIQGAFMHS